MGEVLGEAAEESGRSSAHVNIFDALHAIETTLMSSCGGSTSSVQWEDIAAFAFGPDWRTTTTTSTSSSVSASDNSADNGETSTSNTTSSAAESSASNNNNNNNNSTNHSADGTVPKNQNTANHTEIQKSNSKNHKLKHARIIKQQQRGWHAPYLDVVLPYPCRRTFNRNSTFLQQNQQNQQYKSVEESCFEPPLTSSSSTTLSSGGGGGKEKHPIEGNKDKVVAKQKTLSIAARRKAMQAESNMEKQLRSIQDGLWGGVAMNEENDDDVIRINGHGNPASVDHNMKMDKDGSSDSIADDSHKQQAAAAPSNMKSNASEQPSSAKRVKLANGSKSDAHTHTDAANATAAVTQKNANGEQPLLPSGSSSKRRDGPAEEVRPSYIPSFCPPFPPPHTYLAQSVIPATMSTSMGSAARTAMDCYKDDDYHRVNTFVRDNLVRLKQQNQHASQTQTVTSGSSRNGDTVSSSQHQHSTNNNINTNTICKLRVPGGIKPEQQQQSSSEKGRRNNKKPPAAPLSLPSGSRVTRILEGSLDAA